MEKLKKKGIGIIMGFKFGSITIPYYGFFIVLGIIISAIVGWIQVKKYHKDYNDFIILVSVVGLGAVLGAKILYFIVSWEQIDFSRIMDLEYLNAIMSGGFVYYGGLIGGLISLLVCKYILKLDIFSYISIAIPCIPIAHGFGRLGCSAVGCCYGVPYDGFYSIVYHNSYFAPNNIALFPVQFTEAILNFLIAALLLIFINTRKTVFHHGLCLYLLLYAPVRFFLEVFRYDEKERGIYGCFSVSQWISIGIICITIGYLLWNRMKNRKV